MTDGHKIRELVESLRVLADLTDSSSTLHQLQVFLEVAAAEARGDTLEIGDIAKRVGIERPAASRDIAALGDWHYRQKTGQQLITTKIDPSDRRRKSVVLTRKGDTVIKQALEKFR